VTPTNDRKSGEAYATFIAILGVVTTVGIVLTAGLSWLADSLGPQAGDIITFVAARAPSVSTGVITAGRAATTGKASCILDVQTMQRSGGSLVVESKRFAPKRIFQVHWAGARTSNGPDDCGTSADLLVSIDEVAALIFAAGGKGVKAQN